jgi:NHL repeat
MLAACGGALTASNAISPAQTGAVSQARLDAGGGCPLKRCVAVTRENGYHNKPLPGVLFFARDANGNVSPAGEITGSKTMLSLPSGLAMDSSGNVYVANNNNTITVYAAGALGNTAPIRTISGNEAKLNNPGGLAIDSSDELYVANCPNTGRSWINAYASNASGNAAPIRTIEGRRTHLYCPWGLAFDSQSNMYVANDDPNNGWITVYAADANGDTAPKRTIRGDHTKLSGPAGLAVDASGYIYVVDSELESMCIFSPNARGDRAPVSYFSGPIYGFGIGLDGHDNMYVTSVGYDDLPSITVIAAGTIGNQGRILRLIEGRKTELNFPRGIVVR